MNGFLIILCCQSQGYPWRWRVLHPVFLCFNTRCWNGNSWGGGPLLPSHGESKKNAKIPSGENNDTRYMPKLFHPSKSPIQILRTWIGRSISMTSWIGRLSWHIWGDLAFPPSISHEMLLSSKFPPILFFFSACIRYWISRYFPDCVSRLHGHSGK